MGDNGDDKYYYNNYNYNKSHNQLDGHVNMATVALITGLIAIPLCFVMNIGIVLGGVAVVLGILSKGSEKKLLPQAKRGIIYGTIGIVLGYIVFVSSMHTILTDPTYRQQLNQMSEQMNGQSFDDLLKELGLSDL
ncbi:hypothetical protein [Butyrivibrio sp.]|jgi:uncharacterized membrane protein HdeD (DUF308 family)|uniref:hypothetical protein n=1 Tax=Butyrivibrio sp. TaxID=28121 RepID=UPI001B4CF0DD|nr:hypothetical protein [Butyrivibrio sp.]MBE5836609.1 hypothetical protein [Butyrivibrio sp.]MBP3819131.1 hypothetical protein [Butyrivibrio sp.]MBQ9301901.1 hypothetical protein [Butyrivibrio sp.]